MHPKVLVAGAFLLTTLMGASQLAVADKTTDSEKTSTSASVQFDPNIFVKLAKKIVPSVVNISTFTSAKAQLAPGNPDDLLHRFFEDMLRQRRGGRGTPPPNQEPGDDDGEPRLGPKAMSLGTGFIIDASGLILTNNHVVGDADEIKISFTESEEEVPTDGEVVGRDPELDVALIKVKTTRVLEPVIFGDSENLEVGEYVIAVGNPFGQGHSVTHGIVSAKGRLAPDFPLAKYIQTDAPINPGNSGGPLVNLKGEVIGINNAIEARAQGIGFAIPISTVKLVLPQLRTKGSVTRGYIGILVHELTPEIAAKLNLSKNIRAPLVSQVFAGEPADKAGIKPYDLILEFDGKPVRSHSDLIAAVTAVPVGTSVPVKIMRSGKEQSLTIAVIQRPTGQQKAPEKKKKGEKKQGRIDTGMILENLTPEIATEMGITGMDRGVVVSSTAYQGPADNAGILRGDIILEVDRKPVKTVEEFFGFVNKRKSFLLRIRRSDPQGGDGFLVIVLDLK